MFRIIFLCVLNWFTPFDHYTYIIYALRLPDCRGCWYLRYLLMFVQVPLPARVLQQLRVECYASTFHSYTEVYRSSSIYYIHCIRFLLGRSFSCLSAHAKGGSTLFEHILQGG